MTRRDAALHFLWSLCVYLALAIAILVAAFVAQDNRWIPSHDVPSKHNCVPSSCTPVPATTVPVPTPEEK